MTEANSLPEKLADADECELGLFATSQFHGMYQFIARDPSISVPVELSERVVLDDAGCFVP
jgi:hypothetical protein